MKIAQIGIVLAALALGGCAATGPMMSTMKDSIPAVAPDKGRVFFYRTSSLFGAAITADIRLNGEVVGRSTRGSFFYVDQSAGNSEVTTATETEKKLTFALAGAEVKYVRTRVGIGLLVGRIIPELVGADEAQKEMASLAYVGKP